MSDVQFQECAHCTCTFATVGDEKYCPFCENDEMGVLRQELRELIQQWRDIEDTYGRDGPNAYSVATKECADELEELLDE